MDLLAHAVFIMAIVIAFYVVWKVSEWLGKVRDWLIAKVEALSERWKQ